MGLKKGNWVEKGPFLVQLDRERFLAAVQHAEANVRSIEADAKLAKENLLKVEKDYQLSKESFQRQLESQAIHNQAYAAYQVEKARYQSAVEMVEQARTTLKQAQDDLSKTTIYAPMSGAISALNKELGEIALGSQFQEDVILIVSDLKGMEAWVDVDENDIVNVAIGESATIEVDALPDKIFKGIVTEIASSAKISGQGSVDQKTNFEVKIHVLDVGDLLRPGMTASSDIITDINDNTLSAPIQCAAVRTPDQLKPLKTTIEPNEAMADDSSLQNYVPNKDGFMEVVFVVKDKMVEAQPVVRLVKKKPGKFSVVAP